MSFSGIVSIYSFNLLFFTQVLTVLTSTIKYNEYVTDKGKNLSVPCEVDGDIMWFKQIGNDTVIIQTGHTLVLTNLTESDSGVYVCLAAYADLNGTNSSTLIEPTNSSLYYDDEYYQYLKIAIRVRTPPGPVSQLYFQTSTVLGYLIWRFNKKDSGGYPIKSFTTEYRNASDMDNETYPWVRLDPTNIAPNVRQMEVYRLLPNKTYEFRIWANNNLGPGEIVTTNVTTLPETDENDLIRLIQADIENFDVRAWIFAVSVVLGALVILGLGLCIVSARECYEGSFVDEDGWDSIELVPNIILNPGFCENDDQETPYTRTIIFGEDDESDGYDEDADSEDKEPFTETIKRKVSVFFTGHTIRRM